jgi:hypothetical protein
MRCIASKPKENMEMSVTGSSSQSECSAYTLSTNMKSDNLVNFQQRFNHFNPEAQTPHSSDTNSISGQSVYSNTHICDQNHNPVQNYKYEKMSDTPFHPTSRAISCISPYPELRPNCSCNIHIQFNIRYSPSTLTCQCQCSRHCTGCNFNFGQGSGEQPVCRGDSLVCDV